MNQQPPPPPVVAVTKRADREAEDLLVFGRHVPRTNDNDNENSSTTTTGTDNIPSTTTTSFSSFLGDTMTQLVDEALKKGVASLPLLHNNNTNNKDNNSDNNETNSNPAEAALIQKLKDVYYRNIDIIEMYADHQIFTLDMYPPTRRQNIVRTYLQEQQQQQQQQDVSNDGERDATTATLNQSSDAQDNAKAAASLKTAEDDDDDRKDEEPMTNSALDDIPVVSFPSKEDVPTPEQMEALAEETKQLRAKLQEMKLERTKWLVKCKVLEQVQANTEQVAQAMQASTRMATTAIDQSVTAVIMGKQGLEQLHARAVDLLQELDEKKKTQQPLGGLGKENRSKKPRLSFAPEKVIQQSRALLQASEEGREKLRSIIRESNE